MLSVFFNVQHIEKRFFLACAHRPVCGYKSLFILRIMPYMLAVLFYSEIVFAPEQIVRCYVKYIGKFNDIISARIVYIIFPNNRTSSYMVFFLDRNS